MVFTSATENLGGSLSVGRLGFNRLTISSFISTSVAFLNALSSCIAFLVSEICFVVATSFTFFVFHVTHGLGVFSGLIKLIFRIAPISKV